MPSYSNTPAMQSHMENQVNFITEMTRKTYDSFRRLSELNLQLAQELIDDSVNAGRQFLSCSDPMQLSALAMNQMEPVSRHLRSYQQQLMGVLAGVQVDLTRTAEAQIPGASRSATAVAEEMARRATEASEAFSRRAAEAGEAFARQAGFGDGAAQPSGHGANGEHHTPG